jgi:hypothetical protein
MGWEALALSGRSDDKARQSRVDKRCLRWAPSRLGVPSLDVGPEGWAQSHPHGPDEWHGCLVAVGTRQNGGRA